MAQSTFNVISLGKMDAIDTREGNTTAENAKHLVGEEFGSEKEPLWQNMQELNPGSTGVDGGTANVYDMATDSDTFSLDGGPDQTFDGTSVYKATITYTDGSQAQISAVIFQDTDGNTYLAPEYSLNADQMALQAKPIQELSLDSLIGNRWTGMYAERENFDFAVCFCAGTLIATREGARPVEDLAPGDLVLTRDNGFQKLRWTKSREMDATARLAPVRFEVGALGKGLPRRVLRVSPQHRMLMRSKVAARMFGTSEVLISAKKLLGLPGVTQEAPGPVSYHHLLFVRHEIVLAEGAPAESLHLGDQALKAMDAQQRDELRAIFPDLRLAVPARPVAERQAAREVMRRHAKNAKPVLEF
ncbi:MAG: Hint domain-containing protein [Pseudomonadota bacterium]